MCYVYLPLGIKVLKNVSVGTFSSEKALFNCNPSSTYQNCSPPLHTEFGLMVLLSTLKIRGQQIALRKNPISHNPWSVVEERKFDDELNDLEKCNGICPYVLLPISWELWKLRFVVQNQSISIFFGLPMTQWQASLTIPSSSFTDFPSVALHCQQSYCWSKLFLTDFQVSRSFTMNVGSVSWGYCTVYQWTLLPKFRRSLLPPSSLSAWLEREIIKFM